MVLKENVQPQSDDPNPLKQNHLRERAVDPTVLVHREYFERHPDRLERFNDPKSIADVIPQATDPEHPLHETFWQMVVSGGILLTLEELDELLGL